MLPETMEDLLGGQDDVSAERARGHKVDTGSDIINYSFYREAARCPLEPARAAGNHVLFGHRLVDDVAQR